MKKSVNPSTPAAVKKRLDKHHIEAETARACLNSDVAYCLINMNKTLSIPIDLQQIILIATLNQSDMFYLRQLSMYNFGIHVHNLNDGMMFVWNETEGSRGANNIFSNIFTLFNNTTHFGEADN